MHRCDGGVRAIRRARSVPWPQCTIHIYGETIPPIHIDLPIDCFDVSLFQYLHRKAVTTGREQAYKRYLETIDFRVPKYWKNA